MPKLRQTCKADKGIKKAGVNCYLCKVKDPNETHYDPSVHGICTRHGVALWELANKGLEFDMRKSTVVVRLAD